MPPGDELIHPSLPAHVKRVLAHARRRRPRGRPGRRQRARPARRRRGRHRQLGRRRPRRGPRRSPRCSPRRPGENRFGTVTIVGPAPVEVTSYRTEGGYSDRRRPDEVRFGASLEEDLARRDFTINAIAWVPTDLPAGRGRVVDPFGGRADLDGPAPAHRRRAARALRRGRAAPGPCGALRRPLRDDHRSGHRGRHPGAGAHRGERLGRSAIRDELPAHAPRRAAVARASRCSSGSACWASSFPSSPRCAACRRPRSCPATRWTTRWRRSTRSRRHHDPSCGWPPCSTTSARRRPWRDGHFIGHDRVGAELAAAVLERLRVPGWEAAEIIHAVRAPHVRLRAATGPMPPCGASSAASSRSARRSSSRCAVPTTPPPGSGERGRRTRPSSSVGSPRSWSGSPTSSSATGSRSTVTTSSASWGWRPARASASSWIGSWSAFSTTRRSTSGRRCCGWPSEDPMVR